MTVDLASGTAGIVKFRSGETYYCPAVQPDGDRFSVRIESGWYNDYNRDGTCRDVFPPRDIVEYITCGYKDPRAKGLPSEVSP